MNNKTLIIFLVFSLSIALTGCPWKKDGENGTSGRNGQTGGRIDVENTPEINLLYNTCQDMLEKIPSSIIFIFRSINGLENNPDLQNFINAVYPDLAWDYGVSDMFEPVGIDRDEYVQVEYSVEILSNRNFYYAKIYRFPDDFISEDTIEIDDDNLTLKEVGNGFLWEAEQGENSYGFLMDYLIIGEGDFVEDIIKCLDDNCSRQAILDDDEISYVWDIFKPGFIFVVSTVGQGLESVEIGNILDLGTGGDKPITTNGAFFELVDEETVQQTLVYVFDTPEEAEDAELVLVETAEERINAEQLDREIEGSYVDESRVVITVTGTLVRAEEDRNTGREDVRNDDTRNGRGSGGRTKYDENEREHGSNSGKR